jgi:hypothetical protein
VFWKYAQAFGTIGRVINCPERFLDRPGAVDQEGTAIGAIRRRYISNVNLLATMSSIIK